MFSQPSKSQLIFDGVVGLSLTLVGLVGHVIYQGAVEFVPAIGLLVLTAVCAVVAYLRGKQFGEADLP